MKEGDERKVSDIVWHASAEVEYALFLFSVLCPDEEPSGKPDPSVKQSEAGPALVSAQGLLEEAKKDMDAGDLHEAYEKIWMARNHLLKIQENFDKEWKRRGKSTPRWSASSL